MFGTSVSSRDLEHQNADLSSSGGQRKIRPYWRNYFENTHVLVRLPLEGVSLALTLRVLVRSM